MKAILYIYTVRVYEATNSIGINNDGTENSS